GVRRPRARARRVSRSRRAAVPVLQLRRRLSLPVASAFRRNRLRRERTRDTLHFYTCQVYSARYVGGGGMAAEKPALAQGTLDLLILQIVALGPIHGYAIARRIQQISRDVLEVPQGSLYPALHRLENRKLLAASWKASETGREAKFYHLTRAGRARLEAETASWKQIADAVRLILRAGEGGA